MKKILLIVALLVIIGGMYFLNSKSTKDLTDQNESTQTNTNLTIDSMSTSTKTYKIEEIAKHNKDGDCWTTISGKVYDLTTWPSKHPGGDKAIFAICGIDGTKAFEKAHASQDKPANVLDSFYIGQLTK